MKARNAIALIALAMAGGAGFAWWSARATMQPAPRCGPPAGDASHPGMVWVQGGSFRFGADAAFPEEGPASGATVEGFWMDQTEVTNAQFAQFVAATGYRTLAERGVRTGSDPQSPVVAGSAVFRPRGEGEAMRSFVNWWQFMPGADWRHPDGPQSSIEGRDHYPVVHIAFEDAQAYANWKGHALPTEEQFEYAAQGAGRKNASGDWAANTWQGSFPSHNLAADGFAGASPVACFGANRHGLHDVIGNVWEWTRSPYFDRHDSADRTTHPDGYDPTQPDERDIAVVKGGSFLCSPDYCMRYRPEARIGQSKGLGTAHIGFRTVALRLGP
jgi:formylglycine-generating enzyme